MEHIAVIMGSGLVVGGLLGTLGAGGSVITVPILVYVLGESVGSAAVTSLLIVSVTAASGAIGHGRAGTVRLPTALALSAVSAAGSWPGSLLRAGIGGRAYLLAFAALLALASAFVWLRPAAAAGDRSARECVLHPDAWACAKLGGSGLALGFLTGFFGVGGGFVIVPVLLLVLAFPMREAVGTSLVVVAAASAMALVASLGASAIDWRVALPFALLGVVGSSVGRRLAARLNEALLRRAFAVALAGLAAFLVIRNG
jgi:uncharacterized membrane protein YfcA